MAVSKPTDTDKKAVKARKRGQNEGSIFEESPGKWRASISLGFKNGQDGEPESAEIVVTPTRNFDLGEGRGREVRKTVQGGVAGVLIDARGRPLQLPTGTIGPTGNHISFDEIRIDQHVGGLIAE